MYGCTKRVLIALKICKRSAQWKAGSVRGLCARGGFIVDVSWKDRGLQLVTIRSQLGGPCTVRLGDKVLTLRTRVGEILAFGPGLERLDR